MLIFIAISKKIDDKIEELKKMINNDIIKGLKQNYPQCRDYNYTFSLKVTSKRKGKRSKRCKNVIDIESILDDEVE